MKNKVAIFKEDYKPNLKKITKAILKIQSFVLFLHLFTQLKKIAQN